MTRPLARGALCGALAWCLSLGPVPPHIFPVRGAHLPITQPVHLGPAAIAPRGTP